MQSSLDGDNSAGARKTLAKVQKMLQLVSTKRHALALRDYRETLDECVKTEASANMKILGYRMASRVPTCTTHEIWQLLLEASVMELASSQNAPVLLYSIPVLEQIPLPLVVGFLISSEKEPMNKLRAVLQHEQSDVRCCAIASLSRITLDAAVSVASDGLFAFPFESHESRIVCQQDLWTIIADVWKIIFQALTHGDIAQQQPSVEVAGAAFTAMRMLFAKTSVMAPFNVAQHLSPARDRLAAHSAANDLAASVYKEAFPRVRSLLACAQRLPIKHQVDAAWWLAMLLHMMMDRSGATCPGPSVAYIEIDMVKTNPSDDDDDDENATAERVRMDAFASNVLETWLVPLFGHKLPLAQGASVCRAVFIVLAHPLQAFTRMKVACSLVQQLIAQCYFHKSADVKLEMSHLLMRAFAWVSSSDCVTVFPRVVEAVHLMERETDRQDLLQLVMEGITNRVLNSRDFLLLESLTAMDVFRVPSGTSKLSPRMSGSHVYRALVQSLIPQDPQPNTRMELQVAQLIVLKAFIQVLLYKTNASVFAHPQKDHEMHDVVCYVALLSQHFENMVRQQGLALKESLQFYQHDLQCAWKQITSCVVRLQLLKIGFQLHKRYQTLPFAKLQELLDYEVAQSFSSGDNDGDFLNDAFGASTSSAVFDDGKLGGESVHGAIYGDPDGRSGHRDELNVAMAVAISEILKSYSSANPQQHFQLQELQAKVRSYFAAHSSTSSLLTHIMEDPLVSEPNTMDTVYAFETFYPGSVFQPPRHQLELASAPAEPGGTGSSTLITGSADPLSLRVYYQQTIAGHEDVITLNISCCNTSNLALTDFEIHIRPRGPVVCIDPSNDLKIRVQQGGSGTASSLPPFGTLKAEKRFLIQRLSQADFYFQVVYHEADSTGGGDDPVAIRVAPATPFTVNFDALFSRPATAFATGSFFRQIWSSTDDCTSFEVESTLGSSQPLSCGQLILQNLNPRVAIVAELLVDLPLHSQLCFLTKTKWDEYVVASLTLSLSSRTSWRGIFELRSSKAAIDEMAKHPSDVLSMFCGTQVGVAKSSGSATATATDSSSTSRTASRTASRSASRTVSYSAKPLVPTLVVDPFAGHAAFPTADLTVSKWDANANANANGGGFSTDAFGGDQLRPTEPPHAAFGGGFSSVFGSSSSPLTNDP